MIEKNRQSAPPSGLETMLLEHREALVRFLRARGASDHAEDLVQELWLRISQATTRPVADPVNYLYRSANNLMISRFRSEGRMARRDQQWGNATLEEVIPSAEEAAAARSEIAEAEERLRSLGERVFRVFVMFRLEGMQQREIARAMGISLSAIEKDLQRAYRAIADLSGERNAE